MKVMVTGVNGRLGKAVAVECERRRIQFIGLVKQAVDIIDALALRRVIQEFNPTVVINCAAYTDVDGAENNVCHTMAVNVIGAANIAKILSSMDAKMIHISTDYIFDGRKIEYKPSDAPNPLSIYSMSKLAGERAVTAILRERALIVRTSWLYGHGSSPSFPEKALQWVKKKGKKKIARIDNSQRSVPTYTPDLANALMDLVGCAWKKDIIHIVGNGGGATRAEWAKVVYKAAKWDVEIIPAQPGEFKEIAKRPMRSVLVSDVKLPSWQKSTEKFMKNRRIPRGVK